MEGHSELSRQGENDLRPALPACRHYLLGGSLRTHGQKGKCIANAEPGILLAMVPFEKSVAGTSGPH